MARRRTTKRKTRRSRSTAFNIVNAAELYMQTAVITNNVMGTNPFTALTGMEYGTTQYSANSMSRPYSGDSSLGYYPSAASVTLPELLGLDKRSEAGPSGGVSSGAVVPFGQGTAVMKANLQANLMPMLIQTIGVRAGFAIGKRLMSKQRSFINNKVLKPIGLAKAVRV